MGEIDRKRIAAVQHLEAAGYCFKAGEWHPPASTDDPATAAVLEEADAMHALLVLRADALGSCTEGADEAAELERIVDTVERYEAKRWPTGKVVGSKG